MHMNMDLMRRSQGRLSRNREGGGGGQGGGGKKRGDTCCVSIQGLHPSKDPAFAVFEGMPFGETLLSTSNVVKWDSLAFGAFPGCITSCLTLMSPFLLPRPVKVTIYATRCRHFLFFFLLFRANKVSWDM